MKKEGSLMRLFIAIGLPRRIREGLIRDNARIRSLCSRGSFTREENLHLTLSFLGETESERLGAVKAAMDAVTSPPLSLTVGEAGMFASRDGAVVWRSVDGPGLAELRRSLSDELEVRGFRQEKRRFVPHLTVARRVVIFRGADLHALTQDLTPAGFIAGEITLFLSEQENGIRKYTPLYRKALGERPSDAAD